MKNIALSIATLSLVLSSHAIAQKAAPAGPKHHVIFQLNEAQGPAWDSIIRHVTNMRKVFEKDGGSEVEIVFYAQGLKMLLKTNTEFEERLKKLSDEGVVLAACQNAMKVMNVKTEDLFPFASQVDSAIAELARKQEAGWAYIH
jgi:intracellular sulfur oxidation DsrE/DsrF family protein